MKKRNPISGLIALNIVLLAVLALIQFAPAVRAEGSSVAGDYVIVGGSLNGATSNAVYVLDQRSGALLSFLYDRSSKRLNGIAVRSVVNDGKRAAPSR
ncbi:MAG: hypothetical protein IT430_12550 [Phycisphaerales bacterium]|nr:hypothetical protein [Phycisphaerales bacterium]